MSRQRAILPPILMVIFVDTLGYAAVVPLIPFVLRAQHVPLVAVGMVFAAFSLCQLITAPLLGRLSDWVGRRPVLALSLAGSVVGFALLALSAAFPVVVLSRVIDGSSAGNVAMCYAAVLDDDRESERRRGIPALGAAAGGGLVAGLGLSAFLAGFGFRAVALAAMFLSLLSLVVVVVAVPETRRRAGAALNVSVALRQREVRRGVAFVALCAALQAAFLLALPVYLAGALRLRAQATTALIALLVVVAAAFQLVALPRLLSRLGSAATARALLAGALCAAVFVALIAGGSLPVVLSAALMTMAVAALSSVSTLLLAENNPGVPTGLIMGLNASSATAGQIAGPLAGYAAFAAGGSRALGLGCAAIALCAAGTLGLRAWWKGQTSHNATAVAQPSPSARSGLPQNTPSLPQVGRGPKGGAANGCEPCPVLWVVVPFYNEAAGIQPTLAALAAQRDRNFTLLLVDNGSTDGSADVVQRVLSGSPISRWHLIHEPQKGTGAAADTGFRFAIAAGATHIARTDADCLPDPGWIAAIRAGFAFGAELLAGEIGPRRDEGPLRFGEETFLRLVVAFAAWFGRVRPGNRDPRYLTGYIMAPGNNMAITADLYLACGGFPRSAIEKTHEDRALVNAARLITPNIARRRDMLVLNSLRRLRRWGLRRTLLWYWDHRWLPDEVDIR